VWRKSVNAQQTYRGNNTTNAWTENNTSAAAPISGGRRHKNTRPSSVQPRDNEKQQQLRAEPTAYVDTTNGWRDMSSADIDFPSFLSSLNASEKKTE